MNAHKIGVLLINLGTPQTPTTRGVRDYLVDFLSDKRVVELPAFLWKPLLKGLILPIRAKRSARLYQSIWTQEGSPLAVYSKRLAEKVQLILGDKFKLVLGMRYGKPSLQAGLNALLTAKIQSIVVLPLYPQYSAATTASCFDVIAKVFKQSRFIPSLHWISSYFEHPLYIHALAHQIQQYWSKHGKKAYLLFSFHGLPKRCSQLGDPYEPQCHTTARLLATQLQLAENSYKVVFQSRFGKTVWLQPYCDITLQQLAAQGVKNVAVICPGFAVDCLETLEEIAERYRAIFLQAGGESFHYIPALNDAQEQVQFITSLVKQVTSNV